MLIPLYSFLNCLTPTFIASTCQTQIITHYITAAFGGVDTLCSIGNHVHTLSEDLWAHILVRISVVPINFSGKERFPSIACSDISTLPTWRWIYPKRKQRHFQIFFQENQLVCACRTGAKIFTFPFTFAHCKGATSGINITLNTCNICPTWNKGDGGRWLSICTPIARIPRTRTFWQWEKKLYQ